MICTILTASALSLLPVKPVFHTVGYYDRLIHVTERVLDRSICPVAEQMTAVDMEGWDQLSEDRKQARIDFSEVRKIAQREALVKHCKARVGKANEKECNLN